MATLAVDNNHQRQKNDDNVKHMDDDTDNAVLTTVQENKRIQSQCTIDNTNVSTKKEIDHTMTMKKAIGQPCFKCS